MATSYNETIGARSIAGAVATASGSTPYLLDCTAGSGWTYTAANIEFTGGVAALKNQYASDVLAAATFDSTMNFLYSKNGGTTAYNAVTGGTAIVSNKLKLSSTGDDIRFAAFNNVPTAGKGCIRFRITPHYSGSPAGNQIFYQHMAQIGTTQNWCLIQHGADGNLLLYVYNGANAAKCTLSYAWSPTADTEYEIEGNYNTNGTHALYVDGSRVATTTSTDSADIRSSLISIILLGEHLNDGGAYSPNFSIQDLMIFSEQQNTGATRTTGYTVSSTKFLTSDPTITLTTGIAANGLAAFDANVSASGSDGIKFHILVGAQARYWNGSAWANSDGTYAQSNTAADINTNASALEAGTYKVVAVFHSNDGSTTPYLAGVTLGIE